MRNCEPRERGRAAGTGRGVRAVLVALVLAGCGGDAPPVARTAATDLPSQEVRDFTLEESNAGRREWVLTSRYAATYDAQGVIRANDVTVDFYDTAGEKASHLTAREGIVQRPSNDMEAKGDVVVTTTDGVRIETSSLKFLNREGKIVSDAFVRLERNGDVVTGVGFESDPQLEHFTLKREVRAQVQTSPGGGLRFRERSAQ